MRASAARPTQAGFTLVELMVSLVIFSFAVAGILSVAVAMTNGMREQRAAVQAESAVRVPMDFLADALRQSSPGVALPKNLMDAGTCVKGALTVSNAPGGTNGVYTIMPNTDTLDVIYAAGAVVTSTRSDYTTGTTSLTVNDATQLAAGDYIVITDFTYGHFVRIASKTGNVLTLDAQCGAVALPSCAANCTAGTTLGYGKASTVIRAQHALFFVAQDLLDGSSTPALMMDPDSTGTTSTAEPLAEGIEDLQIAVGVETDNVAGLTDATTTTDEWKGNVTGDTAVNALVDDIRAVRITMIARTGALMGGKNTFTRPAAEDHTAGSGDNYRRRILRSLVELRNNGSSK